MLAMNWETSTGILVPLAAIAVIFGIRLIKVLTNHQQQMTRIINEGTVGSGAGMQIDSLRREVDSLRTAVSQLATSVDHLRALQERSGAPEPALSERIQEGVQ